jgi:hypothetical protein
MILRIIIAFICFSNSLYSQSVDDSLKLDSIPQHSVKKAIIFSAIIPASGQVYNYLAIEKHTKGRNNIFFKIPIYYSALGATGYLLMQNEIKELSLKKEYNYRIANPGSKLDTKWDQYDNLDLLTLYNKASTRRDLFIVAFGATYFFQIIDAGIGAHFVKFDLSEDLTLQVRPKIFSSNTIGVGFNINFR